MSGKRRLDLYLSIACLVLCASAWPNVLSIRRPAYAQISPALWTSLSLAVFTFLSGAYLVRSIVWLRIGRNSEMRELPSQWYVNPLITLVAFIIFVAAIPYVGMLLSSSAFMMGLLVLTGHGSRKSLVTDLTLTVGFVGVVYALFAFGFRIIFPAGSLTGF
jgi:hypothetical protein